MQYNSNSRWSIAGLLLVVVTILTASSIPGMGVQASEISLPESWTAQPSGFIENAGQVLNSEGDPAPDIRYTLRKGSAQVFLLDEGITYTWQGEDERQRIDMRLLGANPESMKAALPVGEASFNYYTSSCPEGVEGLRPYEQVTYHNVYDHIDMVVYNRQGANIKYDFVVHAGGNPEDIAIAYAGHDKLEYTASGFRVVAVGSEIIEENLVARQAGKAIAMKPVIEGNRLTFSVGGYDPEQTLILDPPVSWATYIGGNDNDHFFGLTTDSSGNVIAVGRSNSTDFPTLSAFQSNVSGSNDLIVSKFDPQGNLLWSTYYGGTSGDNGYDVDCGTGDNIAIGGSTASGFPTANAHQSSHGGVQDAFVLYLDANGVRQWATYYGGSQGDEGQGIAMAADGSVFLTGLAISNNNIGTSGTHQSSNFSGSSWDGFLVKFNSNGVRQWGTYAGGTGLDHMLDVDVDPYGNAFITGYGRSTSGVATSGALQTSYSGPTSSGRYNAYMMKFNGSNGSKAWGTYYGTSSAGELGHMVACDNDGNAYFMGSAAAGLFMLNSHDATHNGGAESFILKLDSLGNPLWSTYLGGSGNDLTGNSYTFNFHAGLKVDQDDQLHVAFTTTSTDLTMINPVQASLAGGRDAALFRFDSSGVLQWSTYYGGSQDDYGFDLAVIDSNTVYIAGGTESTDLPVTANAYQDSLAAGMDAYIVQFAQNQSQVLTSCCDSTDVHVLACFPFTGDATDGSMNSNNGTLVGNPTLTTDRFGNSDQAYHFDGNDRINAGNASMLNFTSGDFTISGWFNASDLSGRREILSNQATTLGIYGSYGLRLESGVPKFTIRKHCCSNHYTTISGVNSVTANEWHHIVGVGDSTAGLMRLYVDGQLLDTASWNGILYSAGNYDLNIGAFFKADATGDYLGYFDGDLDEIQVYGQALDDAGVQDLYTCSQSTVTAAISRFERLIGTDSIDNIQNSLTLADGGLLIVGLTGISGNDEILALRLDPQGDTLWAKQYGGSGGDVARGAITTADGGFMLTGFTTSYGAGSTDAFLLKLDANGNEVWSKTYGHGSEDRGAAVIQTADLGYALVGQTNLGPGGWAGYVVKTDASGNISWTKALGQNGHDFLYSLCETSDNGIVVAGEAWGTQTGLGSSNALVMKFSSSGTLVWERILGSGSREYFLDITPTSDNGLVAVGYTEGFGAGSKDALAVKLADDGSVVWSQVYGGATYDAATSVEETSDQGFIIAGSSNSFSAAADFDFYLIRTDSLGDTLWTRTFGDTTGHEGVADGFVPTGPSVGVHPDGGFWLVGERRDLTVATDRNLYLLRLDDQGESPGCRQQYVPSSVSSISPSLGTSVSISSGGSMQTFTPSTLPYYPMIQTLCADSGEVVDSTQNLSVLNCTNTDPTCFGDSLVVCYPFDSNALDQSGNGNDGIVIGATLATDRFGAANSAYYFDGSDDYIIIDGGQQTFDQYAISLWFNTTTLNWGSSWKAGILFSGNHAGSNRLGKPNIHLEEDGTVRATGGYPGGCCYPEIVSDTGMGDGDWHFVLANYNDLIDAFEFYVDGQLIGQDTSYTRPLFMENTNSSNGNLTLGYRNGNSQYYEGMLDDFRIHNRNLTACEVLELYHHGEQLTVVVEADSVALGDSAVIGLVGTDPSQHYQLFDTTGNFLHGTSVAGHADTIYLTSDALADTTVFQIQITDTATGCSRIYSCPIVIRQSCESEITTQGLIAHYSFSGNADDNSGNGHDGTVNGATLTTDRFGQANSAYYFDGTDDFIGIPHDDSLSFPDNKFTFSFWIKPDEAHFGGVLGKRWWGTAGAHWEYNVFTTPSELRVLTWHNGGNCSAYDPPSDSNYAASAWRHYVVSADGNEMRVYINGALEFIQPRDQNCSMVNAGWSIRIGTGGGSGVLYYFKGSLDDIHMYSRSLDACEARALYVDGTIGTCNTSAGMIGLAAGCAGDSLQWASTATEFNAQTWYVDGVAQGSDSLLDLSFATAGTYQIELIASGTRCADTVSQQLVIHPNPSAFLAPVADQCIDNTPVALSNGFPSGGAYTGNAVATGIFYPDSAGVGIHAIQYAYTDSNGCSASDSITVSVHPLPVVQLDTLPDLCVADSVQLLNASPAGGVLQGAGVSSGSFFPAIAGAGSHSISYSYTDTNGCSDTTAVSVTVFAQPTVTFTNPSALCIDAAPVNLTGASPVGGTFSGSGVSGTTIDPGQAGAGVTAITYQFTDTNGCVDSAVANLTVHALPVVQFQPWSALCLDATPVMLTGGFPAGGVYQGGGVSGNQFEPAVAGIGMHQINYSYTDTNGCSNQDSGFVQVDSLPNVQFPNLPDLCADATPITLSTAIPAGGVYGGVGVSNGDFFSSLSGTGTFVLSYDYADSNGCAASDSAMITVNALPVVTHEPLPDFCEGDFGVVMDGGMPFGGFYSGPGVAANVFDPGPAGVGSHTVVYAYVDTNGCIDSAFIPVSVFALPVVNLGNDTSLCAPDTILLDAGNGFLNYAWSDQSTFSTLEVTTSGIYSVTVEDANQCSNEDEIIVTVNTPPVLDLGADTISTTGDPVVLDGGSFASYLWSDGSTGSTLTVTSSGLVSLQVTDFNGCTAVDTIEVTIWPTSVEELEDHAGVRVYPNPTAGELTIEWSEGGRDRTLYLWSVTGQVLMQRQLVNETSCSLNLHTLPAGLYYLQIEEGAESFFKKVVKH